MFPKVMSTPGTPSLDTTSSASSDDIDGADMSIPTTAEYGKLRGKLELLN